MQYYLIRFTYSHYCQGYEKVTETVLVEEVSFDWACILLKNNYKDADNFENLTLRGT